MEEFAVAAFLRNSVYVLGLELHVWVSLCIFKTELHVPQDGDYVPGLGKLGCWPAQPLPQIWKPGSSYRLPSENVDRGLLSMQMAF